MNYLSLRYVTILALFFLNFIPIWADNLSYSIESRDTYRNETKDNFDNDPQIALVVAGVLNNVDADGCVGVGGTITYTFTVHNLGDVSLTDISVEDYLFQTPNDIIYTAGDTDNDNELDVGETWIFQGTYTINEEDVALGRVDNQARVNAIVSGSLICEYPEIWGENGQSWDPNGILKDYSNVGYMQGDVAIPNWEIGVNVVDDFNAVGDGIADDTQAFRDAIAACPANKAVFVPNGRYKITDWIKIDDKDNFVLRGEDMYETILEFPNNLNEIRPENNYVHANGGGFIYFNGGTQRSIENFTLEFREETHLGHFSGTGANGIYTSDLENSWIRNIHVRNANMALRINGNQITVQNILLDQFEERPLYQNQMNMVGHYGITLTGTTNSLVHDVLITGEWAHDIGTHQAANNNVFSKVRSLVGGVITHKSGSDKDNLYTEFDLGPEPRFSGSSRSGTVYWNLKAGANIPYPDESLGNVAVGYPTDQATSTSDNHWHESIDANYMCPPNLYLAQLEIAGKPLPAPGLVLPPSWPVPNPNQAAPIDDTFASDRIDDPNGNKTYLWLGSNQFRDRRIFLKFNFEQSVLTEADQAILRLYGTDVEGSYNYTALGIEDDSWTEDELTYINMPTGGVEISDTTVESGEGWYEWDVTSFVNNQLEGDKIVSLYLRDIDLSGGRTDWNSKESPFYHPELILIPSADAPPQYPLPSNEPENVTIVTDLSGTSVNNDDYTSTALCQDILNTPDFNLDDIEISPNPFTENITVTLPPRLAGENVKVSIIDILGRIVVDNITSSNGVVEISNLDNLANALYFLNIQSDTSNEKIVKKIIKK